MDRHGGVIMGYRGDGYLAVFGLRPSPSGNPVQDALRAAWDQAGTFRVSATVRRLR